MIKFIDYKSLSELEEAAKVYGKTVFECAISCSFRIIEEGKLYYHVFYKIK